MASPTKMGALTPVIFRMDRDGEVMAVFPTIPFDKVGILMSCFTAREGHASCDEGWYVDSRLATIAEYEELRKMLEGHPFYYRLSVYDRITARHRDAFLENLSQRRMLP